MAKADVVPTQSAPVKPIPLFRFAETVKGTGDEVWLGILRAYHASEKRDIAGWNAVIDSYRSRPAHKG
jgi:hypothetical protein